MDKHAVHRQSDETSELTGSSSRNHKFSGTPDQHGEITCSKRPRKVDRSAVLLEKLGTELIEKGDEHSAKCDRIKFDNHPADDDTISGTVHQTAFVGSACDESSASNQNYWQRICKMGLANFVHARGDHENVSTVDTINGQGNSCFLGSEGQRPEYCPEGARADCAQDVCHDAGRARRCGEDASRGQTGTAHPEQYSSPESDTPLVQARAVHCRLDDIADDLRRGCEAIERNKGLRGRSFLVPAEWGAEGCRCALEALAMEVFTYHTRGMAFDRGCSGAEWWVQVSYR
jgi:hypothetical protein